MVAIVAGNGLGLLNTSFNIIGVKGILGQSILGQGGIRAVVNTVNGNLVLQSQDAQLTGCGSDLFALHTYNSLSVPADNNADSWRWVYEQTVTFQGPGTPHHPGAGATVVRTAGDGHETAYTWDATLGAFITNEGSGAHDELTYDGTAAEWVWTDGSLRVTERYSDSIGPNMTGLLVSSTDTSNNSIGMTYDQGRLTVIRDTASQQELRLRYDQFNGLVRPRRIEALQLAEDANGHPTSTLRDPLLLVEYDYDNQGRLISVTRFLEPDDSGAPSGTGFSITYGYEDSNSNRIANIMQSDGTILSFTYDSTGRVSSVINQSGSPGTQLVLAYDPPSNSTTIADGNGQIWTCRHDGLEGRLVEVLTPQVGGTSLSTKFQYDVAGNLKDTTNPLDNTVIYRYDMAGNPEFERDAVGNMVTRTFNSLNQVVTETRYRIADPDGDGPQLADDPVTSRYVYDTASRLRFLVSPEGRVTENRYGSETNGFGLLTQTLLYVGQLYDVTGLGPTQQVTEAELMEWVAELSDMTQVQLTEYNYDLRGNINQQTRYTTVDITGTGVLDEHASVAEYVYNAHSMVKKRIAVRDSVRSVVSSFTYDGIMRVLTNSGIDGSQTTVYDDANRSVTVTSASGLKETRKHDSRGRLVSVSQEDDKSSSISSTVRRTRYVYDNADWLRMVEDAQGGRRYHFYDAAGRLEFKVDATGAVTRLENDAAGLLTRQTLYLNKADTTNWYDSATDTVTKVSLNVGTAAGSDVIIDTTHDRVTTFDYDKAGRLTTSTDAIDTVTVITYDGLSRVVMTQTGDRVTRYMYDKDNHRVGIVDALGYFTEYKYDAGGRLVETVRYSERSPAATNMGTPMWIGATQQIVERGRPFRYRLAAYDADGDPLTFSSVGAMPAWMSFDAETATLYGNPPINATSESIILRVDDGLSHTATDIMMSFTVIEAPASAGQELGGPDWASLSSLDIIANEPVSYVVPAAVGGGTSLIYRVVEGLPAGLSFDSSTRLLTGSPNAVGFYTILLQATEAGGQSTNRTLSVRIRTVEMSPAQTTGSDQPSAWRPVNGQRLHSFLYYDGQGRVVGAVDEQQFLTETVYNEFLNIRQTLRYLLPVVVTDGDTLASVKSRAGTAQTMSFTKYDNFGRVHEVTALDGSTLTRNEYDEAGRLTRVVSAASTSEERAARTFYNAFGEVIATLGGEGDVWLGPNPTPQRIEQAIREFGIRNEYDTLGRLVRSIDANGNLTIFYYDRENRRTHTINVIGHSADNNLAGEVSETIYNSFSQPELIRRYALRLRDADMKQLLAAPDGGGGLADQLLLDKLTMLADARIDQVNLYEYDRCGRLVRQIDAEGGFTDNIYNLFGELIARTRPTGQGRTTTSTSQFDYDLLGRLVSETDDVGCINANKHTDYDAFGRIVRTIDSLGGLTTTTYIDNGRSIVVTDPLQRATRTDYDAFGRISRLTNALGRETKYSNDEATRSVTVTTPEGRQVTTTRTRHGETLSVIDGRGNVTQFGFNRDGQPTTVIDPLSQLIAQTVYDKAGRKVEVTDARGTVTRFRYDQRNRVVEQLVDPSGVNLKTLFAFDALGQQIRVTEAAGTAAKQMTTYRFDRNGRTRRTVLDDGASGLRLSTTYKYDHLGNVVAVARGTVSTPNRDVTLYEFDNLGRCVKEIAAPSSVLGTGPLGTRDLTTHYRYDTSGHLIRRVDPNGESTWQIYDAAGQLTHSISALGEVSESHYDAAGQLIHSHRYLERLPAITLDGFGDVTHLLFTTPPTTPGDQRSYAVYDDDGQVRFNLKATGPTDWVVGEIRYDANYNIIEKLAYDRFVPDARISALDSTASPGITTAEIRQELSSLGYDDDDPVSLMSVPRTYMAYDAKNRQRFTVDPLGSVTENAYDSAGNVVALMLFAMRPDLVEHTEAAINTAVDRINPDNRVTHFAYDAVSRLRYTVNALGSVTENEFDPRGNIVTTVRWSTRPSLTHYSESAIESALPPMSTTNDQITHFVFDIADRLRFTIGATGSVCENVYDEVGNVIVTTLFAQRPVLASGSLEEAVVAAALDPLRGDDENQITHFAYDAASRLRFTVDALGSVTESMYDANGNLIAKTSFAARPILTQYDESEITAAVASLQSDPWNRTTHFAYDSASRLRFTVDALGSVTEQIYNALGSIIGIERFAARPSLGQYSESTIEAAVVPHRGDPDNRIEHHLLDALGRIRFIIRRLSVGAGRHSLYSVNSQEFNAVGQPTKSIGYATAVPLATITEAEIAVAVSGDADPFRDRVSHFVFDLAGHQIYRLDGVSIDTNHLTYRISAQDFDSFGQVFKSTNYAATTAELDDVFNKDSVDAAVQTVADPARDRVSAVVYDVLGQPIYTIQVLGPDAHGLNKADYNPLGRVFRTTRYANTIGALANFNYQTVEAAVNAVASENDRKAQYVYDATGLQRFVLEADMTGHWTVGEKRYDSFDNLIESRRYDRYVTDDWISTIDAMRPMGTLEEDIIGQLAVLGYSDTNPSSMTSIQRSHFAYDRQNHLRFTVDALGGVAENVYDALGDLTTTVRFASPPALAEYTENAITAAVDRSDASNRLQHLVYDLLGHLRFTVKVIEPIIGSDGSSKHCINERRYDALDQMVESHAYATMVGSIASYDEATVAEAVVSDPMNDRRSMFAYDSGGRQAFVVRALWVGRLDIFNSRIHRIASIVQDEELRITHVGLEGDEVHTVSDIIHLMNIGHSFFTLENNVRATVVARTHPTTGRRYLTTNPDDRNENNLDSLPPRALDQFGQGMYIITKQVHNALGELVHRIDYALPVALPQFDSASIQGAIVEDFRNDRTTTYIRDAAGRLRFEIKPDLSFGENKYDALDQMIEVALFNFKLPSHAQRTESEMIVLRGDHEVGDDITQGLVHSFDAAGRLISTIDALDNTERYEYDALSDRQRWTDKNGNRFVCTYDRKGQKISETCPLLKFKLRGEDLVTTAPDRVLETQLQYDAFGNLISKIEAANFAIDAIITEFSFDTIGRPTGTLYDGFYDVVTGSVEREPGANRFKPEASMVYDTLGNVVRVGKRMGLGMNNNTFEHTWKTYDNQGHVVHEINALNNVTHYTYNSFDEQETVTRYSITISGTPQNGVYWTPTEIDPQLNFGVDETGHVMEDWLARTIRLTYDMLGHKNSVTYPTAMYYSTQMPGDASQANHFRPSSREVTRVEDASVTVYEYNAFGDVVLQRGSANTIVEWQDTSYTRDTMGRWTRSVDAAGNVTVSLYDTFGNLVRQEELTGEQDGTDRITEFVYNALNQQIRIDRYGLRYTDADGIEHGALTWSQQNGGEWVDLDADVPTTVRSTTYDGYGRRLIVTDAAGNSTSMQYNALGQMIEVIAPECVVAPLAANDENAVDPFRDQLSETLVTSMTLDPFGRVVRQQLATSQGANSRQTLQNYDIGGNLVSTTDAEGHIKLRAYDAAGRIIRETQSIHSDLGPLGINEQGLERRYTYDVIGQLTETLDFYIDGTDDMQSGKSVLYNPFEEVVFEQRKWWDPPSQTMRTAKVTRYDYDNAGHVIFKEAADGHTIYFYNLLGQMTREEKTGNQIVTDGIPDKRITEIQYDVLGRPIMVRRPAFTADVSAGTEMKFRLVTPYSNKTLDRWGNVVATQEGGYEFVNDQPVFAPNRIFRSFGHDDNNKLIWERLGTFEFVSSNGVLRQALISKQMFRDLLGNIVKEVDGARDPQSEELINSRERRIQYDNIGQLTAEIDATDRRIEYAYNIHSERVGTRNAHGTVLFDRYNRNGSVIFHGILRTINSSGAGGEYNSHTGTTDTLTRTYINAFLYDQANRRFARKTFIDGENAPWSYTWLDGRNLGVKQSDVIGIVTQYGFDPFSNKSLEIDGAGIRSTWTASTEDYSVGRIINYRQPNNFGTEFCEYLYNDFNEVRLHLVGNTRTEYEYNNYGLVHKVTTMPNVSSSTVLENNVYRYDVRGQLVGEVIWGGAGPVPSKRPVHSKQISYDNQGRLSRVEHVTHPQIGGNTTCFLSYAYDEWSNVRHIHADGVAGFQEPVSQPFSRDSAYDYDKAGRITLRKVFKLDEDDFDLTVNSKGSTSITYDDVGRRSEIKDFYKSNRTGFPPHSGFTWDTIHDERYIYDDLGHLLRITQRNRQIRIINWTTHESTQREGVWRPQSIRDVNLRGDILRVQQWDRDTNTGMGGDVPPTFLGTTNTSYHADGQVSFTKNDASDPIKKSETLYHYIDQTKLLDSYEFSGFRSNGTEFRTTFQYRYTTKNGQRVVSSILDGTNNFRTDKTYDLLGRLTSETLDLPRPNGQAGSDREEDRYYQYNSTRRIIFKNTRLRLTESDGGLPDPSTGEQTYIYIGNRIVGTIGENRLDVGKKFDFAYTPMSEVTGSGSSRHIVQRGESLIDIAHASYGDGALWHIIADANGIMSEPTLPLDEAEVGKAYEIPDVVRSSHTASTSNLFGMGEIIGNDRPIFIPLPRPPQPNQFQIFVPSILSTAVQIAATVGLSYVGVPVAVSAGIGAGLGNLTGQATAWALDTPGKEGIDWGSVGTTSFEGFGFGLLGPYSDAVFREVWQQAKSDETSWMSGSKPNWSNIGGSLFRIGANVLDSYLYDAEADSYFSRPPARPITMGGLINSAYNPSSGWNGLGAFGYVYGANMNSLAELGYTEISKWLNKPSVPGSEQGRFMDEREGPLRLELLEMLSDEDRRYIEGLSRRSKNRSISANSNQVKHLKTMFAGWGTSDYDDKNVIQYREELIGPDSEAFNQLSNEDRESLRLAMNQMSNEDRENFLLSLKNPIVMEGKVPYPHLDNLFKAERLGFVTLHNLEDQERMLKYEIKNRKIEYRPVWTAEEHTDWILASEETRRYMEESKWEEFVGRHWLEYLEKKDAEFEENNRKTDLFANFVKKAIIGLFGGAALATGIGLGGGALMAGGARLGSAGSAVITGGKTLAYRGATAYLRKPLIQLAVGLGYGVLAPLGAPEFPGSSAVGQGIKKSITAIASSGDDVVRMAASSGDDVARQIVTNVPARSGGQPPSGGGVGGSGGSGDLVYIGINRQLAAAPPTIVNPGALLPHEVAFAREIAEFRGGELIGVVKRSAPGIDATLEGLPISLKETSGALMSILTRASQGESQARNAGYTGVELFIRAARHTTEAVSGFARGGQQGLLNIPGQGVISRIYILTANGWYVIPGP